MVIGPAPSDKQHFPKMTGFHWNHVYRDQLDRPTSKVPFLNWAWNSLSNHYKYTPVYPRDISRHVGGRGVQVWLRLTVMSISVKKRGWRGIASARLSSRRCMGQTWQWHIRILHKMSFPTDSNADSLANVGRWRSAVKLFFLSNYWKKKFCFLFLKLKPVAVSHFLAHDRLADSLESVRQNAESGDTKRTVQVWLRLTVMSISVKKRGWRGIASARLSSRRCMGQTWQWHIRILHKISFPTDSNADNSANVGRWRSTVKLFSEQLLQKKSFVSCF